MISIVVCVFNEGETTTLFVREAARFKSEIGEIILVDDGSPGELPDMQALASETGLKIKVLTLQNNVGKDRATLIGLSHAECEFTALMDIDQQFSFEDMLCLKNSLTETGDDIVHVLKEEYFSIWNLLFRLFSFLTRVKGYEKNISDFAVARSGILKQSLERYNLSPIFSLKGALPGISSRSRSVRVKIRERISGNSKMDFTRLLDVFTATYLLAFPNIVRLSFVWAFAFFIFAVGYSLWICYQKIFLNSTPPGYPSEIIIEMIGFSFVFFFIGILSEYLNALVKQLIVKKPHALVRKLQEFLPGSSSGEGNG